MVAKQSLKKPTIAVKRVGFFVDSSSAGGVSNTLSTAKLYNLSFDYFKFGFTGNFDPFSPFFMNLLKILKISPVIYDEESGVFGYEKRIVYNSNITILYQAKEFSKTKDGSDNFIFEMKGQACLEFDERNCSWVDLLEYCLKHDGKATRLDFAIDDLSGNITIKELKEKVNKKFYTSNLKKIIVQGDESILEDYEDFVPVNMIESKNNNGFTLTFGSKITKELCIYNKKAERLEKKYQVYVDSWLRYEARFYKVYAEKVSRLVLVALKENRFPDVVFALIRGLVVFKEDNNLDFRSQYQAKTWEKWDYLLNNVVEKINITNKSLFEKNISTRIYWFRDYVNIMLKQIYLIDPANFINNMKYFLLKNADNLSNSQLADINKARLELGKEPYKNNNSAVWLLKEKIEFDDDSDLIDVIFKNDK